jgi:hypothetical protein
MTVALHWRSSGSLRSPIEGARRTPTVRKEAVSRAARFGLKVNLKVGPPLRAKGKGAQ